MAFEVDRISLRKEINRVAIEDTRRTWQLFAGGKIKMIGMTFCANMMLGVSKYAGDY